MTSIYFLFKVLYCINVSILIKLLLLRYYYQIMQEAAFVNVVKTILIIVFCYYTFKFLVRLFAPFLLKKAVSKMQEKAQQQYNNQQKTTNVREGETVIDKRPQSSQNSNNNVGEYVDFEEID